MDLTDVAPSVLGSSAKQWSARLVSRIALVAKSSRIDKGLWRGEGGRQQFSKEERNED